MARYLEVERCSLHSWMRMLARTYLTLTPARRHWGARRVALVWMVGIGTDLAVASWIRRRPDRNGTPWRFGLNTLDMAWWSKYGPEGRFDSGVSIVGVPLIAETVVRRGVPAASLWAAASGSAVAALEFHRGAPVRLRSYRWHLLAILTGMVLRGYAERHFRQRGDERGAALEPDWVEAYGVGQRNVAAAVDGISDYLGRMSRWLPEGRKRDELMKRAVEVRAVRGSRMAATQYLKEVLLEWVDMHNQGCRFVPVEGWHEPEGPVSLNRVLVTKSLVEPNDGLVKLAASQAAELTVLLELQVVDLVPEGTGPIAVEVLVAPKARGAPMVLGVNGRRIELQAAEELESAVSRLLEKLGLGGLEQLRPYDPVAATFVLGAGWQLNTILASGCEVPARWAVPLAATNVIAGVDVHRRAGRDSADSAVSPVARSLLLAALGTVVVTRTMRSDTKSDGVRVVPAIEELELPALILALNWSELSGAQRLKAIAATAGIVIAGDLLPQSCRSFQSSRPSLVDHLLNAMWPIMGVGPIATARRSLRREEMRLQELLPLEQRYVQAFAEWSGTDDLARDALEVFEEAVAIIGQSSGDEENRLRALALRDVHRIERKVRELKEEVDVRLTAYESKFGIRRGTPHVVVSNLPDALHIAEGASEVLILDIENTLTGYGPTPQASRDALQAAAQAVERHVGIRRLYFVSNSPLSLTPPSSSIDVVVVSRARKPLVELSPLRGLRDELAGATVCGDQLLTDGLLARRLAGTFVEYRGPARSTSAPEPLWPRLMRAFGERLVRGAFSPLVHDSTGLTTTATGREPKDTSSR